LHVHWKSTTQTSRAICIENRRPAINSNTGNGEARSPLGIEGTLELRETFTVETPDGQQIEFEVVGLVEDEEKTAYAVCYSEEADEFVVSDVKGNLLADTALAQEILDDFFALAEEGAAEDETENDEEEKP